MEEEINNDSEDEAREKLPHKSKNWITAVIIIAVIVISIVAIYYPRPIQDVDCDVTCCIGENSVMVALKGCGACNKQKELFGNKFEDLNVIYCEDNEQFCLDNNIMAVPTWIIDDEKYVGMQPIDELKELTGC